MTSSKLVFCTCNMLIKSKLTLLVICHAYVRFCSNTFLFTSLLLLQEEELHSYCNLHHHHHHHHHFFINICVHSICKRLQYQCSLHKLTLISNCYSLVIFILFIRFINHSLIFQMKVCVSFHVQSFFLLMESFITFYLIFDNFNYIILISRLV